MEQAPNVPPPMKSGANPYDFINDPKQPKQPLGSGMSKQKRILLVVAGIITLVIVGSGISSFIASLGDEVKKDILKTQQQQVELQRVSEIGIKQASSPATKNLASTINFTMVSDGAKLADLAQKAGMKSDKKTLSGGSNPATNSILENALQNNQFDQAFTEVIISLLKEYQVSLQRVHKSSENVDNKQILSGMYDSAQVLIEEAESVK